MDSAHSEQPESFGLIDFLAWVENNRKTLIIGVLAITVAIMGVGLYNWSKDATEAEANEALASNPAFLGNEDTHPDPAVFKKVAADYPSTGSGERAVVLAGMAQYEQGNYAEARSTFSKLIAEHPDSVLLRDAQFGVASSLDAEGKGEEALAKYQELVKGATGTGNVEIKLNMARLYEKAGKPDQSLAVYESLKGLPNSTLWEAEIEERTRQLLIDHPGLAKAAPAMTSTATNAVAPVKAKP